jgi:hypothetical protein
MTDDEEHTYLLAVGGVLAGHFLQLGGVDAQRRGQGGEGA